MRRFPWAVVIFVFAFAMVVVGFWRSLPGEFKTMKQIDAAKNAKSAFYAALTIQYDNPPIYQEEYKMSDIEGVSSFSYRVQGFSGKQITDSDDGHRRIDVSSFCGVNGILDQAGIWQLVNKAPRPGATVHYTVYVKQVVDFKEGDRTVTFTDPKYWATTAGRQYNLNLSKVNPDQLLSLKATSTADPHYQQIVDAFRAFGPDFFRSDAAKARATVAASK